MPSAAFHTRVTPLWRAWVRRRLTELAQPVLKRPDGGLFSLTLEVPVPPLDAPPEGFERWFFCWRPSTGQCQLGLGEVFSVSADGGQRFARLQAEYQRLLESWTQLSHGVTQPVARAFIGFQFDEQAAADSQWQGFDNASLHVPRLLLQWHGQRCTLSFNCLRGAGQPASRILARWQQDLDLLLRAPTRPLAVPQARACRDQPAPEHWQQAVREVRQAVATGRLNKVVLARSQQLAFTAAVPHRALLAELAAQNPDCLILSVCRGGPVLVAATPERLFSLHDGQVECEALAGTTAPDEAADAGPMLEYEHQPVIDAICEALEPLCQHLHVAERTEHWRLAALAHLRTRIRGRLQPGVSAFSLLDALHPTPAVGGRPRAPALDWIRRHEHFARGWYSGGLGLLGDDGDAWVAVILRCALIAGQQARLYAGAGITGISDPAREWRETCLKLRTMRRVLLS